jgi:hypothetical protein
MSYQRYMAYNPSYLSQEYRYQSPSPYDESDLGDCALGIIGSFLKLACLI